jgi:Protein of unknown function (DUF4019)
MTKIKRLFPALLFSTALAACSVSADTKKVEQEIQHFHKLLDAGNSAEIYESAAEELKKVSTQEDFVAFLDAVHRKLGVVKTSGQKGWNMNYNTSGKFVTLNYETIYAEGKAAEQFVYRVTDEGALLVGYHVNSNALILK